MFQNLKSISLNVFDFVCDKTIVISEKIYIKQIVEKVIGVARTLQIPLIANTIVGFFIKDPITNLEYTAVKTAVDMASQHRQEYNNNTQPI